MLIRLRNVSKSSDMMGSGKSNQKVSDFFFSCIISNVSFSILAILPGNSAG